MSIKNNLHETISCIHKYYKLKARGKFIEISEVKTDFRMSL